MLNCLPSPDELSRNDQGYDQQCIFDVYASIPWAAFHPAARELRLNLRMRIAQFTQPVTAPIPFKLTLKMERLIARLFDSLSLG